VRRRLVLCVVAVMMFAAMAVAQDGALLPGPIVVTDQTYPMWGGPGSLPHSLRGPLTAVSNVLAPAVALGTTGAQPFFSRAEMPNRVIQQGAGESGTGETKELVTFLKNVAGSGRAGFSGDGGLAMDADLNLNQDSLLERSGIAVATDGTIYIADTKNSTIRAVAGSSSSEPGIIRSVVGKWAPAQNVPLVEPMGIAVDRAGNLYVGDHTAGTVSVLTKATGQLTVLAHVRSPASLAVTTDGTKVFVASPETGGVFTVTTLNGAIKTAAQFAPAVTSTQAPRSGACASIDKGQAAAPPGATNATAIAAVPAPGLAQSICPTGVAVDGRGNVFVADANSGTILRVDAASGKVSDAVTGILDPGDIAFDRQGDLFVSEQGRNRILVMPEVGDPPGSLALTPPSPPAGCAQGASFTYCNEPSAGSSPSFAFTLKNTSATTVSNIAITPAFVPVGTEPPPAPTNFTTTSTSCTTTLTSGQSCLINVAFTPLAAGPITGQLSVSDSVPSDTQTINLAGTGDDFSMDIVSGQSPEVTVAQGNTATFMAELKADSVFGQEGETVTLQCPSNLPSFTTCEFKPCPLTPVVGGSVPFSILIHTSTATVETPPIPNPCNTPAAAVRRHRAGGPSGVLYITTPPATGSASRFPALARFLALLLLAGFGFGAIRASRADAEANARRVFAAFALLAVASGLVVACHKGNPANSTATPIAVTNMNVVANAMDSSGNSLHASRGLQITLDVIQQQINFP
jgi:sugar lactone lactonase YvrE